MQSDLAVVEKKVKITEENKPIDEQYVTLNGKEIKIGPGYQRILTMYNLRSDGHPTPMYQISFFTPTIEDNEEYRNLRSDFLQTLLKTALDDVSKLVEAVKNMDNVAVQA